jgi:Protein of unknown function (DUF3293)
MRRPSCQTEGFLFSASQLAPDTIQAYLETHYRVHGEPGFTLRVGEVCPELATALQQQRVDCSAFLTACNPFSQPLDEPANAARQTALAQELSRRSLAFLPGIGQHPSNDWPGEESFLVFGLERGRCRPATDPAAMNPWAWSARCKAI